MAIEPERRRSSRVAVDGDGASGLLRGAHPFQVRDLSAGGLRLGLPVSVEPGSIHHLTALLGGLSLAAPVRITRCRRATPPAAGDDPGWEVGAEFLWRDGADAAALGRWLDGRRDGRS